MPMTISSGCDEQEFLHAVRLNGLLQFNLDKAGGRLKIPDLELVHVARDGNDAIIGGIAGVTYLSALEIEVLWVDEACRRQGIASRLLEHVETKAGTAGSRLSHLTTCSFQAPLFYRKNGYAVCGEVDGFPGRYQAVRLEEAVMMQVAAACQLAAWGAWSVRVAQSPKCSPGWRVSWKAMSSSRTSTGSSSAVADSR